MRQPQPFYKKSHRAWYVERSGKQVRLAETEEAAWTEYHKVMAGQLPVTDKTTVAEIVASFLKWSRKTASRQLTNGTEIIARVSRSTRAHD